MRYNLRRSNLDWVQRVCCNLPEKTATIQERIRIMSEDKRIDVVALRSMFDKCLRPDGLIDLDVYVVCYHNLYTFFCLLGKIFAFVASDVHSKLGILERHRKSEIGAYYATIQSMLEYEKTLKFDIKGKQGPSGARTLLRLHRALEFVTEFLSCIINYEDQDKTAPAAQEAYKNTLSKYHPWVIRQGAHVSMYALPTALELVNITCQQPIGEVRAVLPELVNMARTVYKNTQKLFEDYGCLDLP